MFSLDWSPLGHTISKFKVSIPASLWDIRQKYAFRDSNHLTAMSTPLRLGWITLQECLYQDNHFLSMKVVPLLPPFVIWTTLLSLPVWLDIYFYDKKSRKITSWKKKSCSHPLHINDMLCHFSHKGQKIEGKIFCIFRSVFCRYWGSSLKRPGHCNRRMVLNSRNSCCAPRRFLIWFCQGSLTQ